MSLRRSQRDIDAHVAQSKLEGAIHQAIGETDLTYVEALQSLAAVEQNLLKYMLRLERHGDETKEAGLEHDDD
jgi:hypothetical protein